jgi:hypothetical protein
VSLLLLLLGCAAVHPTLDGRVSGRVAMEPPPGWELGANRRAFGSDHVVLMAPDQVTSVTVDLVREGARTRALPLHIVAETYALDHGRSLGIEAALIDVQEIELADRRAVAVTTSRRHGPQVVLASTVVARTETHMLLVTLHTLPEADPRIIQDWGALLESVELPFDPPGEEPPFLEDALLEQEIDALPAPPTDDDQEWP